MNMMPAEDTSMDPVMEPEWDERLRSHGYRITSARQLILEAVTRLGHATPEDILSEVQETATAINLSTVYRTLDVLQEVGLVTHAHLGHRSPTYHAAGAHAHVHLVCSSCGQVQDVPAALVSETITRLRAEIGFETDVHHLSIQGMCATCRTANVTSSDPGDGNVSGDGNLGDCTDGSHVHDVRHAHDVRHTHGEGRGHPPTLSPA